MNDEFGKKITGFPPGSVRFSKATAAYWPDAGGYLDLGALIKRKWWQRKRTLQTRIDHIESDADGLVVILKARIPNEWLPK